MRCCADGVSVLQHPVEFVEHLPQLGPRRRKLDPHVELAAVRIAQEASPTRCATLGPAERS